MPTTETTTADHDAAAATVARYVAGLRTGSPQDVAAAFHPDAVMYGYTDGELVGGPIGNLYDFVRVNGDAPRIRTRIEVLAITPTTAVVRVEMEEDAIGADYTDFHTLIEQDGAWTIIAKTYHQHGA